MKNILLPDQPVSVIVDNTTPIPNGTGNFTGFGMPSLSKSKVAFRGSGNDSEGKKLPGIYIREGNRLNMIADATSSPLNATNPNPSNTEHATFFTDFGDPSCDDNLVVFHGSYNDADGYNPGQGIYLSRQDLPQKPLVKLIETNDEIDGKHVGGLSFGRNGLSGNKLTFIAHLEDGSSGVYKAEIATTQDQCKNGGYTKFGFRNQGQCIQFVNTGK